MHLTCKQKAKFMQMARTATFRCMHVCTYWHRCIHCPLWSSWVHPCNSPVPQTLHIAQTHHAQLHRMEASTRNMQCWANAEPYCTRRITQNMLYLLNSINMHTCIQRRYASVWDILHTTGTGHGPQSRCWATATSCMNGPWSAQACSHCMQEFKHAASIY